MTKAVCALLITWTRVNEMVEAVSSTKGLPWLSWKMLAMWEGPDMQVDKTSVLNPLENQEGPFISPEGFSQQKDAEIRQRVKRGRRRSAGWKDILVILSRWQVVISCTMDEVIVGRRNESFLLSLLGKEGSAWCSLLVLYSIVCILWELIKTPTLFLYTQHSNSI